MTTSPTRQGETLELWAGQAASGDRDALERLVRTIQPRLYGLALRMLWHPQDAEDATQEILIRIITRLSSFRGESRFLTWAYRVGVNVLLNMRQGRMEVARLTFDAFAQDLDRGLSDAAVPGETEAERALLIEEVKIGCTTAMLLCLDRPHRLAYIVGEILDLDHGEAALVLEIQPAAFRKRLSRARSEVVAFTRRKCGLVESANPCRCRRRVSAAMAQGRVVPGALRHARDSDAALKFPAVLAQIRALDALQRTVALYRSHPEPALAKDFALDVRRLVQDAIA
jgi:RNA polymerase sigma factor (sigma-70 family)